MWSPNANPGDFNGFNGFIIFNSVVEYGLGISPCLKDWVLYYFFLSDALVDGPQNGAPPQLWDIKVQAPQMFQEDTKKFRVPHSSLVKVIH